MTRKIALLLLFGVLLGADTAYFGGHFAAGILSLRGERSLNRNRLKESWSLYERALEWGGNAPAIEFDMSRVLVMGLDELEAGAGNRLPFSPEESLHEAFAMIGRRITAEPFNAYMWSQASDVYRHAAATRRSVEVLDLSTLAEDPIDNLLSEERLSLAAQEIAARMEPENYLYNDLIAQFLLDIGAAERAAPFCRRSIAAAPDTRVHAYLDVTDLPPVVLEAAVQGFEDASRAPSLMGEGFLLGEAGRTLTWHGEDRRAAGFFRRAIEADPRLADAEIQLAQLEYRVGNYPEAIAHSDRAATLEPLHPTPHYIAGQSYLALGRLDPAIAELGRARELGPNEMRYFLLLGEALESAGRVKEAERQFVAAANRNPQIAEAWASLLGFYVRQHNEKAAWDVCSRLVSMKAAGGYEDHCASLAGVR